MSSKTIDYNNNDKNQNQNLSGKRTSKRWSSFGGMSLFNFGQASTSLSTLSTLSLNDEEDILPLQTNVIVDNNNNNNNNNNNINQGNNQDSTIIVTVTSAAEYPIIDLSGKSAFYARVTLKYEESLVVNTQQKSSMDIICVLDKSGSMMGTKISSLKNAMNFVINSLTDKDRLSIISFESDSTLIHGLLLMTPENKIKSKSLFANLFAQGGTNILNGMKHGNSILENRKQRNAATCMFLLTDGQDRQCTQEKLDLAKKMKIDGTSLFVFGFGSDHDSEHMTSIANAAEGTFTYIESDDVVTDAFGGTLGTIQGLSLHNINLNIQISERNVMIEKIIAGRYITSKSIDNRSGTISFANMYIGETRDVLLLLSIPSVDEPIQDYELFKAYATYYIQGESIVRDSNSIACNVDRKYINPSDSLLIQRDITVDIHLNRYACTTALTLALSQADNNNFNEAKITIQNALSILKSSISYQVQNNIVMTLQADLLEALQIVSSKEEYRIRGGRANIAEVNANHFIQRECYQKSNRQASVYQTTSSSTMQDKAYHSKKF